MIKIIRFRPFTLEKGTLHNVKSIKPFEDAGLVIEFPKDINEEMNLVYDVTKDLSRGQYRYSDLLTKENIKEKPSTLFTHIHNRDESLPTLWVCREKNGQRTHIEAITNHHQLQTLLSQAIEKGYVESPQKRA